MQSRNPLQRLVTEPRFIGFAGRIGAGKTTAAKYLSVKYGLQYTRYSEVLNTWFSRDDSDKVQLQKLGWEVMGGGMQRELNDHLIGGLDRTRGAAIDGLRHPIDFESLFAALKPSFQLIFLEASPETRYERLNSRYATWEAFQMADTQPVETYIDGLRAQSSLTVSNNDSRERLFANLDAWMAAS